VSFPKGGDKTLITTPEKKYHPKVTRGPIHPTSFAKFLENKTISRMGLEKLEYIIDRELAHF
jgi:hypothetical protein